MVYQQQCPKKIRSGIVFIGIFLFALLLSSCATPPSSPSEPSPRELIKIRLGLQTAPAIAIPYIAYDQGFFKEEGLDVELKEFSAGKFAFQALLSGDLDVATPAEVPVTIALLQGNTKSFTIIAQGVKEMLGEVSMVARIGKNDSTDPRQYFKIQTASKKRKIATSFGSGPEFFTHSFLNYYNISLDEVELINLKPEDMPVALASGSVDAIGIFEPFAFFAKQHTPDAISFENDHDQIYSELVVIIIRNAVIEKNPEASQKILRALIKAENFVKNNPPRAREIIARYTKLDVATLEKIWDKFTFEVTITQKLPEYMDAEAEWARNTKKVPTDAQLPPLLDFIDPQPLHLLRPESVTIINTTQKFTIATQDFTHRFTQ